MGDHPQGDAAPVVAIVDDDEAIRTALGRLVRTIGYEPRTFASGEALLSGFDEVRPACVLTDIQMPGMSGLDLADQLRRLRPDLPIALMTAYPSLASRDPTLAAGAIEYMQKPLNDRRLEAWLSEQIGEPLTG